MTRLGKDCVTAQFVILSEVEGHASSSTKIGDLVCGVTYADPSFLGMTRLGRNESLSFLPSVEITILSLNFAFLTLSFETMCEKLVSFHPLFQLKKSMFLCV